MGAWKSPSGALQTGILQAVFAEVSTDQSISSLTYADILSQAITTGANFLEVFASFSASQVLNVGGGSVRLVVDGVTIRACGIQLGVALGIGGGALHWKQAVTAAAHIVKLQWRTVDVTSAFRIRPVAAPDFEHCSLLLEESTI